MSPAEGGPADPYGARTSLLLIGGLDPTGRAGLARDVAVCADERVHACPVASAVTVQTSDAVRDIDPVAAERIVAQAEAALHETGASWCKTGVLTSRAQVEAVARLASTHRLRIVVDPVVTATSGGRFLDGDGVAALAGLAAQATLVTPNRAEAERLTGIADAQDAARRLVEMGADAALITQGGQRPDVLYDGDEVHLLPTRRVPGLHRGTGCRLATRIACHLARGTAPAQAVRMAHTVLHAELEADAEEQTLDGDRLRHFKELDSWLPRIVAALRNEDVPEVGVNVAYALPGAKDPRRDVLGLAGRITIAGSGIGVTGRLCYGGPHHTGRIAVVLQEYARSARTVMNHRFHEEYLENARAAGLVDQNFRREDEPAAVPSTMEWGVRQAIRENGGAVPDLIWDRGGDGKEAMIRVVADSPAGLIRKLHAMHGTSQVGGPATAIEAGAPWPDGSAKA